MIRKRKFKDIKPKRGNIIKLSLLLSGVCIIKADDEAFVCEVKGIKENADDVTNGDMFLAVCGTQHDGFDYISKAISNGASVIIYEKRKKSFSCDIPGVHFIEVNNARKAAAHIYSNYYGNPERYMKLVGVTGTNGKTTVCRMIKHIIEKNGFVCGITATLGNGVGDDIESADMTTPSPKEFYKLLDSYRKKGAEYAVIEVSSHALVQERLAPCTFEVGAFTNITSDHMDYHKTKERYVSAKCKLFTQSKISLLNGDDENCTTILSRTRGKKVLYSEKKGDVTFSDVCLHGKNGVSFRYKGLSECDVELKLPGEYNVKNAVCAIALCELLGVSCKDSASALKDMECVRGRCEILNTDTDFSVVIDFAHTPDALENILKTCRAFTKGRLICVFGCGGNRDKEKRPTMGMISSRIADVTVITSDNCRNEEPENIISDILRGVDKHSVYKVIPNRTEAIRYALDIARNSDTVLLAGKGHEEYEILKDGTHPYFERNIVKDHLKEKYG